MSRGLGAIRVDLIAGTAGFHSDVDRASAKIGLFQKINTGAGAAIGGAFSLAGRAIGGAFSALTSIQALLISGAAVLGVVKLTHALNEAAETVDNLGKKSATLGIPVQELSVLRFAAGEAGVEFETLTKLAGKAQRGIAQFAKDGTGPAADAFHALGIEVTDSNGKIRTLTELLPEIAVGLQRVDNQAQKLDFAAGIFGREGGQQFVQLLEDSGDFLQNMAVQAEKAKRLGVVFTPEQVARLKEYNDAVGRIGEAWLGLKVKIIDAAAPFLTEMADRLSSFLSALPKIAEKAITTTKEILTGRLSEMNRARFAVIWQDIESIVAVGIKGAIKSIGLAVVAGAHAIAAFAIPILRATFVAMFVEPIGEAIAAGEQKIGELFKAFHASVVAGGDRHRAYWQKLIAEDQKDLKETQDLLGEVSAKLHDADFVNSLTPEDKNDWLNRLTVLQSRIPKLKDEIAKFQAELAGTYGEDEFWLKLSGGIDQAGDAMIGLAADTREGNKALAELSSDANVATFSSQFESAFDESQKFGRALITTAKDMMPFFANIAENIDGLLGISEAMKETAVAAEDLGTAVKTYAPIPVKVVTEWDRFFVGLKSGWEEASIKARDTVGLGRDVFTDLSEGIGGGFASALAKGEMSFRNFGRTALGILTDVAQGAIEAILKFQLMRAILGVTSSLFTPGTTVGAQSGGPLSDPSIGPGVDNIPQFAAGGAFGSSGLISGAQMFGAADGSMNIAGEDGTEAILPLERVGSGLGVRASVAGGGVTVQIIDQRKSGEQPRVQQTRGPNGEQIIRVMIRDEVGRMVGDGAMDRAMGASYGLRRRGTSR